MRFCPFSNGVFLFVGPPGGTPSTPPTEADAGGPYIGAWSEGPGWPDTPLTGTFTAGTDPTPTILWSVYGQFSGPTTSWVWTNEDTLTPTLRLTGASAGTYVLGIALTIDDGVNPAIASLTTYTGTRA